MDVFGNKAHLGPLHRQYLNKEAFPVVGTVLKHAVYKNARGPDPYVQNFMDEIGVTKSKDWGLPRPNPEAAYLSMKKYDKPITHMSEDEVKDMNLAWSWTEKQFGVYMMNSKVRSQEEVISKLDKRTSPGAPFNVHYKTKKELLEGDEEFAAWLEQDWERLANDPNWTSVWVNSLKEELRPWEKLEQNSLRTFTAGSIDMTVHGNRLFADMNEKLYASHLRSASTVGWAPMFGNWHRLMQKLGVFPNGYALDESQYDSSLRAYLMWACARLRWRMLRPEDQTVENFNRLRTIYRNIVNSLILTQDGVLVMKLGGNPSGSINTISDNTLILYALKSYAWIRTFRKEFPTRQPSYQEFEDNVAKALCGDDNTWTVSDWAHKFYNPYKIIDEWKVLGVTTTTDSMEPRKAEELDYLSAHTVYVNGVMCPVYDREKLITSTLFCTKKLKSPAHTLTRVAGILVTGWTDIPYRLFARGLIAWLMENFDPILCNDQDWIIAKSGILTDAQLSTLWSGKEFYPQSLSGSIGKHNPDKRVEMASRKGNKSQAKGPKKTRQQRRNALPKQPKARRANVGKVSGNVNRAPTFKYSKNGNVTICHSEFIQKVPGSANFSITSVPINPGLPAQFNWLWATANQFESYRFKKLHYRFVNSKAGTFAGNVILGIDYDPSDATPFNETELQTYWGAKTGQICEPTTLVANQQALHKIGPSRYTRIGNLSANQDIKLYDCGNFFIATTDCADTSNIGRLFVDYEIELMTPQTQPGASLSCLASAVSPSPAAPMGTSFTVTGNLGITWLSGTTFSVNVPGQYELSSNINGQVVSMALAAAAPSVATLIDSVNDTATELMALHRLNVNGAGDVFTWTPSAASLTAFDMRFAPYTYTNA